MNEEGRAEPFVRRSASEQEAAGFLLRSSDTAGLVNLLEFALAPWQSGPDLHLHDDSDESFYVLAGELEMQVGDERHVLTPGDFAWVPRGVAHTFVNATERPARALTVATPAGLDTFLAEHGSYLEGLSGQPDREVLASIRERHGGRLLGPPIRPTSRSVER